MQSMTAFARVAGDTDVHHIVWEVRSVNHRHLETQFRLPDGFRVFESNYRDHARKLLRRGKLDATLRIERFTDHQGAAIDVEKLQEALAADKAVRNLAPDAQPLSVAELLAWPGVLNRGGNEKDGAETTGAVVGDLFATALDQLLDARRSEGGRILALLEQQLSKVQDLIASITPLADSLLSLQKQRIMDRVAELDVNLDPQRVEQEAVLLVQRADIREELDRLNIHLAEATQLIHNEGPHGRRLNFLTQELNREANTLGAKSVISETSQAALDLKVIIEQIREQVQNLE